MLVIGTIVFLIFALQEAGSESLAWSSPAIIATLAGSAISCLALAVWPWYLSEKIAEDSAIDSTSGRPISRATWSVPVRHFGALGYTGMTTDRPSAESHSSQAISFTQCSSSSVSVCNWPTVVAQKVLALRCYRHLDLPLSVSLSTLSSRPLPQNICNVLSTARSCRLRPYSTHANDQQGAESQASCRRQEESVP